MCVVFKCAHDRLLKKKKKTLQGLACVKHPSQRDFRRETIELLCIVNLNTSCWKVLSCMSWLPGMGQPHVPASGLARLPRQGWVVFYLSGFSAGKGKMTQKRHLRSSALKTTRCPSTVEPCNFLPLSFSTQVFLRSTKLCNHLKPHRFHINKVILVFPLLL